MSIEKFHIEALTAATLALESVATGEAYDIDDLIAGKLALEQLARVEAIKPTASRLLVRLAPFVTVAGYAGSAQGQQAASRLLVSLSDDDLNLRGL